mgnify:CR=1 FL=1
MEKKINLVFDKTTTRLAGYNYGIEVYKNQVEPLIDMSSDIIYITFPKEIVKIASSFVQGFFNVIIKKRGYDSIGKSVIVESDNDGLAIGVYNDLI